MNEGPISTATLGELHELLNQTIASLSNMMTVVEIQQETIKLQRLRIERVEARVSKMAKAMP